jgi:hypothetical protein
MHVSVAKDHGESSFSVTLFFRKVFPQTAELNVGKSGAKSVPELPLSSLAIGRKGLLSKHVAAFSVINTAKLAGSRELAAVA